MAAVLIIDLGGTKSRLGLCCRDGRDADFSALAVYRNADFKDINEVIEWFPQAFHGTGKMAELLETIPIFVVRKDEANLYGALHYARTSQLFPSF